MKKFFNKRAEFFKKVGLWIKKTGIKVGLWFKKVGIQVGLWCKKVGVWFSQIEWNKRIGKSDKGTSDYVKPVIAWSAFGGTLALAVALTLIITLTI